MVQFMVQSNKKYVTLTFMESKKNPNSLQRKELRIRWGVEDSNLRRLSQQIYSLPHLTTLETPRKMHKNKQADRTFEQPPLEPPPGIEPETS